MEWSRISASEILAVMIFCWKLCFLDLTAYAVFSSSRTLNPHPGPSFYLAVLTQRTGQASQPRLKLKTSSVYWPARILFWSLIPTEFDRSSRQYGCRSKSMSIPLPIATVHDNAVLKYNRNWIAISSNKHTICWFCAEYLSIMPKSKRGRISEKAKMITLY